MRLFCSLLKKYVRIAGGNSLLLCTQSSLISLANLLYVLSTYVISIILSETFTMANFCTYLGVATPLLRWFNPTE